MRDPSSTLSQDDIGFVRKVAIGIWKLMGKGVQLDELLSYGTIGMIEARGRFDASRGVPFSVFAHYRVRGAIYDGMRQMTWLSPNAYKRLKLRERSDLYMESAADTAYGSPSRAVARAALGEFAADMSVVYLTTDAAAQAREGVPEAARQPGEEACDLRRVLDEIEKLSDAEKLLLRRIYVDDKPLSEIGKEMELSKSWLCRMHAKAIRKLRGRFGVGGEAIAAPQ